MDNSNAFGHNLRAFMARKGVSEQWLAGQIDVTRQAVNQWLSGKTKPNSDRLKEIASALEITVGDLYGETQLYEPERGELVSGRVLTPKHQTYMADLGRRLKWAREAVTHSINQCCEVLDVQNSEIWKEWEGGTSLPDPIIVNRFCDRFGITMDYLSRGLLSGLDNHVLLHIWKYHPEAIYENPKFTHHR